MRTKGLFSECSICLERMGIKRKILSCGHVYHKRCIRKLVESLRAQCPMCSSPILSVYESNILSKKEAIDVKRLTNDRAMVVLREAINKDAKDVIKMIVNKYDSSRIAYGYIKDRDVKSLEAVIASRALNWHRTVNGETLITAAFSTNDQEIIKLVQALSHELYPSIG